VCQGKCYDPTFSATVRLGNNSFRDFLYAGDAVRIAVELLERGQFGEVYNLGSETGIKMYDLAKLIGKVMGFSDVRVERDEARVRPWEIWHLQSDNTKIRSVWSAGETYHSRITPLEDALSKTVDWYNANGRKWSWE
jgi:nucleoside-diphosphate-sugar epimerase